MARSDEAPGFAELVAATSFSFLRGASQPAEMVEAAIALGYRALGIADRNSVAGVVRAWSALKDLREAGLADGFTLLTGARLAFVDGTPDIVAYPRTRHGWGRLTRLLTRGNMRAVKGDCILHFTDLIDYCDDLQLIIMPHASGGEEEAHPDPPEYHFADDDAGGLEDEVLGHRAQYLHHPSLRAKRSNPYDGEAGGLLRRYAPRKDDSDIGHSALRPVAPFSPKGRGGMSPKPVRSGADSPKTLPTLRLVTPSPPILAETVTRLAAAAPDRVWLAAPMIRSGRDTRRLADTRRIAAAAGVPLIATNDALYATKAQRQLHDVMTCIRHGTSIEKAGRLLEANGERHLKSPAEMVRLYRACPEALAETRRFIEGVSFDLAQLKYQYPHEPVPKGWDADDWLAHIVWSAAHERHGPVLPEKLVRLVEKELAFIKAEKFPHYFLTVHDLVKFARSQDPPILCQGRGSAANSAVCFLLGVTSVDPMQYDLLFSRFVSADRKEPPDIDVDFEHERREEVMQYVYRRYGRHRASIVATVIHYRPRSAVREVGKALGLTEDVTQRLSSTVWGSYASTYDEARLRESGFDPDNPEIARLTHFVQQILHSPRHLSQHVGGFVLTEHRLDETVPILNGAMAERSFIEWDKDDIDALGLMKVDVLALGMLTCIAKAFAMIDGLKSSPSTGRGSVSRSEMVEGDIHLSDAGAPDCAPSVSAARCHLPANGEDHKPLTLAAVDLDSSDAQVYDMLCKGDSVGVFQVESRAQINMLPRLRPRTLYDLTIQVAIVRPGPIQGDMVHPYLRRRSGREDVDFPSPHPGHGPADELRQVLGKTLGVPLFQEQAMKLAMVAACFTDSEANQLRKAMATFRNHGGIDKFRDKMIGGMVRRGYDAAFAERCYKQIEGFGSYGFPESHALSFARLVYISAWIKCHHPAVFAAALLNSQPMGFYAPAQIVRDAREHGVPVCGPDVNASEWDSGVSLSPSPSGEGLGWGGPSALEYLHHPSLRPRPCAGGSNPYSGAAGGLVDLRSPSARRYAPRKDDSDIGHPALALADSPLLPASLKRRGLDAPTLQLGLRQIDGFREAWADAILANRPFVSVEDLARRAGLPTRAMTLLADADALRSLGQDRREGGWDVRRLPGDELPLFAAARARELAAEPDMCLPEMQLGEHVSADYQTIRLSLKAHPMAILRPTLEAEGLKSCAQVSAAKAGARVRMAGIVLVRQRPGNGKAIFVTLEDETGVTNLILWARTFEANRRAVMASRLMEVHGEVQRSPEGVVHLMTHRVFDRSALLATLSEAHRPQITLSRADEFLHPQHPRHTEHRGSHPRNVRTFPKSRDFH